MNQLVEKFGPNLPLLFKLHEIWSVNSQKIITIGVTRCQILRLKCTKFNFGSDPPDPLDLRGLLLREGRGGEEKEGAGMGEGGAE